MDNEKPKGKRGGKQEGAGRPREGAERGKHTIYIEKELMKQLSNNLPRKRDKYINEVLKREAKKDGYYTPPNKNN